MLVPWSTVHFLSWPFLCVPSNSRMEVLAGVVWASEYCMGHCESLWIRVQSSRGRCLLSHLFCFLYVWCYCDKTSAISYFDLSQHLLIVKKSVTKVWFSQNKNHSNFKINNCALQCKFSVSRILFLQSNTQKINFKNLLIYLQKNLLIKVVWE